MEHFFQVQRFYNINNFNVFVLASSKRCKGHHTFLGQIVYEYGEMDLESASLLRCMIVSCLPMCHAVSTPFFFILEFCL